jgi:predicted transcriptional regulator YdeE
MSRAAIVQRTDTLVIGIEVVADFAALSTRVPLAWRELFARLEELPAAAGGRLAEASVELGGGRYRETVGVPIEGPAPAIPKGMSVSRLPAGAFVHHRHEGPVTEIGYGFQVIYDWAGEQGIALGELKLDIGYSPDDRPGPHDLFIGLR